MITHARCMYNFLVHKDQVLEMFAMFKNMVENETGRKIKILRTDHRGEYVNRVFSNFLCNNEIRHQTTAPYSPQQNSIAEQFNRSVANIARTMLNSAGLNIKFWAKAINTAMYIRNRCLSKGIAVKRASPE